MEGAIAKDSLRLLLDPFGTVGDPREAAKVRHPLPEVLFLVTWASTQRLVLCQEAVDSRTNECAVILAILGRLSLNGALATIDAIATNQGIAQAITNTGGDYLLALKRNQPTRHDEVATYFTDPEMTGLPSIEMTDKDHGRIETRRYTVSRDVDWLIGDRHYPDEHGPQSCRLEFLPSRRASQPATSLT